MSTPDWANARNVLCVRLDAMGDVLMCTPAIHAVKQARPNRVLTLLSSASGVALAPYLDDVDAVIGYAAPWIKAGGGHPPSSDSAFIARLAERRFDAAVIFTSYSQSALPAALMCYMAGIPLRLGHCRENPYRMLSHWVRESEPESVIRHEVRRQLDLVGKVGCRVGYRADDARMQFAVRPCDVEAVRHMLGERGIEPRQPWVLMHPGASAPSRRYPPGRWAEVIRALARRTGCPIVLTGDAHEAELIDGIRSACGVRTHSLAGQLDVGQLGAALRLATVVLSNNTGPAHIAAAVDTPLATLYALTNPQHTPWQVESRLLFHDVPCRFCYKSVCPELHHDCLDKVAPHDVVEAVCSLMAGKIHRRAQRR
ncbi:glycosyltransferase family 9 protein [Massilia antarctica]|uniref:Glycosyltransferase family 9 protein n=1 Tax=Massilia antarctica TaxID=2765360 RepID=A0AA49A8L0_9BURK|nr:glycosyltransferase family 9 protein [Massilia antarctica]QPI49907.1 glycosyltransferase family 9 protein [Massilia antarctica]